MHTWSCIKFVLVAFTMCSTAFPAMAGSRSGNDTGRITTLVQGGSFVANGETCGITCQHPSTHFVLKLKRGESCAAKAASACQPMVEVVITGRDPQGRPTTCSRLKYRDGYTERSGPTQCP